MEKLIILIVSLGIIGLIIWWFFGNSKSEAVAAENNGDMQSIQIIVDGGYTPRIVTLKKGVPAKITFLRKDPSGCLDEVIMPDFGVSEKLPVGKPYEVNITPTELGEFKYTCGMQMFSGTVVVK